MNSINQISAFMENRPGQIAEILRILSNHKINLRALNVAETDDYGILRLIADDSDKAADALAAEGFIVSKNEVYAIAVDDRPGGLNELLDKLAADGVDIEYMYSVFRYEAGKAYMIISAKNIDQMKESLAKNDVETASCDMLGLN